MSSNSTIGRERQVRAFLSTQANKWLGEEARRRWADYGFMVAFVVLVLIAASASEVFFTPRNISNLFRQIVTNGLVSLGMLVTILTGGIDLSVGSIVALAGIVAAGLTDQIGLPLAILVALSVGGLAGASAMWNFHPNWAIRADFDYMKLDDDTDSNGVVLSPPQDLMFLGGSFEVNFNPPKYQTMGFTFMLNVGAGAMKMTVDDTYDAGSPANTFDHTYPAFQGGAKIGYQVAPWINIFVNGTAYFILMDAADTSPAFGEAFNNGWVIPVTAGVRLSFLEW